MGDREEDGHVAQPPPSELETRSLGPAANADLRATVLGPPDVTPQGDLLVAKQMKNRVFGRLFNKRERLKIGRYDVLDSLGHGGMGVVYSAYDDELDRKVAIKVMIGSVDRDAELRFKREAQAMARLNHANVVSVHEVGEADGRVFIAMEFVRGESLAEYCQEPRTWQEIIDLYMQACRGLIAAHDAGLVHRDLKPNNIMRGEDGVVKVLDFGLARAGNTEDDQADEQARRRIDERVSSGSVLDVDVTRAGTLLGTPAYMAPEAFAGKPADVRSDQFSICVALYEALYGQLPFSGSTLQELTYNTAQGEIRPPPAGSKVPGWLHRVVVRGLHPKPGMRWPSMRALVDAVVVDPNRRRRRLRIGVGFGLTIVLGMGLSGLLARPVEDCLAVGAELASVWSPSRSNRVRKAFLASGHRLVEDTLNRVVPRLNRYAEDWSEMRVEACESHLAGQQSDRLFDLRTACLDRRRAQLGTLVGAFEAADPAIVEGAAWAAASLPSIVVCGDVDVLTAAVAPPKDLEVRREVKHLRESLAGFSSLVDVGRYEDALTGAEEVLLRAEVLGYEPLTAEALLRLGTAQLEAHQPESARASLSRSARVAIRSGATAVAAEALARRMWIVADPLGQPHVGLADADVAGGFVENQRERHLGWLYHNNHGVALYRSGDVPAAEHAYHEAFSVLEDSKYAYPVEFISTGYNLASLLYASSRPAAAADEFEQVRAQAVGLLGAEHPRVAVITVDLVLALGDIGQREQAHAKLDNSFALLGPGDSYLRASHHTAYANLWLDTRDYAQAYRHAEAAEKIMAAEFPNHQHKIQARALKSLAGIAQGGVGIDLGLGELRAAVREIETAFGSDHEGAGHAHWWLGRGLRAAGRLDEAIVELGRASEIYEQLGSLAPALVGLHGVHLVEALLVHGDLARASSALEGTTKAQDGAALGAQNVYRLALRKLRGDLALAQKDTRAAAHEFAGTCPEMAIIRDQDDSELAGCRLSWAEALGPTREGHTLATQARAAFQSLGPGFAPERTQAERLLRDVASDPHAGLVDG